MANFRAYPGQWLICTSDELAADGIQKDEYHQIAGIPTSMFPSPGVSFVGQTALVSLSELGKHFEPVRQSPKPMVSAPAPKLTWYKKLFK